MTTSMTAAPPGKKKGIHWPELCESVRVNARRRAIQYPALAKRFRVDAEAFCNQPAPATASECLNLHLDQIALNLAWDDLIETYYRQEPMRAARFS